MTNYNNNKNSFNSSVQLMRTDMHSFQTFALAKGTKNSKQQKRTLLSNISEAIDSVETDDFGIRILVIRTDS